MAAMPKAEIRRFLMKGSFTGKLATVREKGGSHVVPIWFVVDDKNRKRGIGDIVFTTGSETTKAKNIRFDKMVSFCVDDDTTIFFCNNIWCCENNALQTKRGSKMGH